MPIAFRAPRDAPKLPNLLNTYPCSSTKGTEEKMKFAARHSKGASGCTFYCVAKDMGVSPRESAMARAPPPRRPTDQDAPQMSPSDKT